MDTARAADLPTFLHRGRIPSLDGLRAVAIVFVLLCHAQQTHGFFPVSPKMHHLMDFGGTGVELFFVISGFLITTLICRELDRTRAVSIPQFYLRRILRIVPAYACFLAVVALAQHEGFYSISGGDWFSALTYTVNFRDHPAWQIGHAWSLSIEEHFYLFWPLVIALGGLLVAQRLAFFLIIFCFVARWVVLLKFREYSPMAQLWTFTRIDTIACGCLLALLARQPIWSQRLDRFTRGPWPIFFLLALPFSIAGSFISAKFQVGIAYTLNALLLTGLSWAAMRNGSNLWARILNHPIFCTIGVGSYSLYLWQQLFLDRTRDNVLTQFPQNLLFAGVAALVSYQLIEKPFLRLKDRLGQRAAPAAASAPVAVLTQ